MINVRRLTVIVFLGAGLLPGISAQESSVQTAAQSEMNLPAQWDLQSCIDYALQQNITIRKNRVNAESTQIDVKTAKATLFPSLSFSTSQNMVNRPYQESSRTISGSEVIETTSKTSYNGNYGLNASWTIYNGSKRLNTIKQEKLNNQAANLDVETSRIVFRNLLLRFTFRFFMQRSPSRSMKIRCKFPLHSATADRNF
mgnify:CR=1 FL=1